MSDPVREAFEKWCYDTVGLNSSQLVMLQGAHLFDAWQQSRREALMEAMKVCEDKGDQFAVLFGETAQRRGYDCAQAIVELIHAAAEEEGT